MPIDTKEEHSLGSKRVNTSKPKKWFTGCKPFILHIISRLLSYGKTMQGENIWTLKMLSLKRNKRYQWTLKYLQSYINHLQPLFFREKKDKKLGMHQSNQIKFLKKKKKIHTWFLLTSTRMTFVNFDCTSLVLFFTPTCIWKYF